MLLAVANWLLDCLCLAAAILAVGATVPWQGLLLAYLTAAGASTLAITPGGLGTVELALTAALVATGLDAPHALAAALVYRIASLWLPAIGGWAAYLLLSSRTGRDVEAAPVADGRTARAPAAVGTGSARSAVPGVLPAGRDGEPAARSGPGAEPRGTVGREHTSSEQRIDGVPASRTASSWWPAGPQPGSGQPAVVLGHEDAGEGRRRPARQPAPR